MPGSSSSAEKHDQHERDRHVHQRAGDGDDELLARLLRDALEPRQPADRQQRHVGRCDPVVAGGEDVAEFMRHHAGEQQDHEGEAVPGLLRPAGGPVGAEDPGQEQDKGDVQADVGSCDAADGQ